MSNDTGSDRIRRDTPDRPFVPRGIGDIGATFRCGSCDRLRSLFGRRIRKVRGLKTYVCRDCAS